MEINRRVRGRTCIILLILGNTATLIAVAGVSDETSSNLDCTNDFDKQMFCQFQAQNCPEYNLTLQSNDGYGMKHCTPSQCDSGQCCCSVQMRLVQGESFTAVVWKEGQRMESKIVNITESIKPKTPTIISVEDVNGSFRVSWKTNTMGFFGDALEANVTYHKKGDTEMVSDFVKPATINGLKFHEISRHNLEPSTTYVVSVKSYTDWSGKFSDSSNEWEFTTCKFQPWSAGSLTDTNSGSHQQSSGISAGSSSHTLTNTKPVDIKAGVQDALGKAFPLLRPVTSVTTNQLRESNEASGLFSAPYNPSSNNDPGSTDFENMSYSIRIPSYPHQKMTVSVATVTSCIQ